MTQAHHLITEIEAFLATNAMAESTFGRLAANDGKFVSRLRAGGRCWPETADRVRRFIFERSGHVVPAAAIQPREAADAA